MYQASVFLGAYYFADRGLFTSPPPPLPPFPRSSSAPLLLLLYYFFASKHLDCVCLGACVCVWKYQVPGDGCQSGQVVPLHLRLLASLQWEHAVLQLNRGSLNHEKSAEIALSAPRILEHRHIYFSPR